MTVPLEDAARLAAEAPPGGVLPPRDDAVRAAYLDLRSDPPRVAESRLRSVAHAFGPRLYLHGELTLVVATGELPPATAAEILAASPDRPADKTDPPLIAAVRGEDLLARLEELMLAGADLCDERTGRPLRDERRTPMAAWTESPPSIAADALQQGARVIVTRFLSPEAAALACNDSNGADDDALAPVELRFTAGYTVRIENIGESPLRLPDDDAVIRQRLAGEAERWLARADAYEPLADFTRRVELASPPGSFAEPLVERITPIVDRWRTKAPRGLMEFACDLRPANEWREA